MAGKVIYLGKAKVMPGLLEALRARCGETRQKRLGIKPFPADFGDLRGIKEEKNELKFREVQSWNADFSLRFVGTGGLKQAD